MQGGQDPHRDHSQGAVVSGTAGTADVSPFPAAPRLMLGVGLLALVLVLLSIPLLIAIRGARARRSLRTSNASPPTPPVDAWAESARRMGGSS